MYNNSFYTERSIKKVTVMITSSFVVCYLLNLIGLESVPSHIGSSGNNINGPVLNVYYGHSFISQETMVHVLLEFYFHFD